MAFNLENKLNMSLDDIAKASRANSHRDHIQQSSGGKIRPGRTSNKASSHPFPTRKETSSIEGSWKHDKFNPNARPDEDDTAEAAEQFANNNNNNHSDSHSGKAGRARAAIKAAATAGGGVDLTKAQRKQLAQQQQMMIQAAQAQMQMQQLMQAQMLGSAMQIAPVVAAATTSAGVVPISNRVAVRSSKSRVTTTNAAPQAVSESTGASAALAAAAALRLNNADVFARLGGFDETTGCKLIVPGLPASVSLMDVQTLFGSCGTITSAALKAGIATVVFEDAQSAQTAFASFNGKSFDGAILSIRVV
ncbi:hypothetical protein CAOG_05482 [Capsaspora owczarzaki ATCC 30864]|uniref:hypothetical protein n=1 Tax=Capsaspora owczarzaki (strain ATCC 30864) TaxID=595528 RepID=UPI0001FE40F6|nr:hypothetical protein CAOG_05482 [Capsaspora owczarzaki ATCC 30864]|eukprot:XP_004346155.1 hypothetical protein CAOG_05482 [Capsaspora owczarzaki ATCC 30864]